MKTNRNDESSKMMITEERGLDDANPPLMNGHNNRRIRNGSSTLLEGGNAEFSAAAAAASSVKKMLSTVGTLTVQKYILQLHQKDERIRTLEEENKNLKVAFKTKTEQLQQRIEDLVKELEQHAQLVLKLEIELTNYRRNGVAAANLKKQAPAKKVRRSMPSQAPKESGVSNASTSHQQQQQLVSSSSATDEICAKLQTFVERNNQQNNVMDQGDGLFDMDEFAVEQMVKMMAEEPALLQAFIQIAGTTAAEDGGELGGMNDANEGATLGNPDNDESSANLLSLLFDAAASSAVMLNEPTVPTTHHQKEEAMDVAEIAPPQHNQQSLDFEEVMQRVIGEAMNNVNGTSGVTNTSTAKTPTLPQNGESRTIGTKSNSSTGSISGNKGGRNKSLGTNFRTPTVPNNKGTTNTTSSIKSEPKTSTSAHATPPASQVQTPSSNHHHSTSSSSTAKPFTPEEQKLVNELETRIDENIVQLGIRPLNTAELAVQCTRIMREYSIGQRLFARTVMCKVSQSQGSLSELLSKPRPWHKLTDKGRDAFRRIFGWISDDTAIDLLCQLSPRKVTLTEKIVHPDPETLLEPLDGREAEAMLESSLANSKKGLISRQAQHHHHRSVSVTHSVPECSAPLKCIKNEPATTTIDATADQMPANKESTGSASISGRWRHDDIPKEKIIDIYEAEKAKLMEQETNLGKTIGLAASSGSSRMGSLSPSRGSTGLANKSRHALNKAQIEVDELLGRCPSNASSTLGSEQGATGIGADFSLLFNSQRSAGGSIRLEPFPIAQSQIERYTHLDTEEIVRQVKEFLAKNAVSQRQFGESVLGLSQGSVSDLLARPKAWNLLTPKGREPFVRMHIFMEQYQAEQRAEEEAKIAKGADGMAIEDGGQIEEEADEEKESNEDSGEELKLELDSTSNPASLAPFRDEDGDEEDEDRERSEIDDNLAAMGNEKHGGEESEKLLQSILAQISTEPEKAETEEEQKRMLEMRTKYNHKSTGIDNRTNNNQQLQAQQQSAAETMGEIDTIDVARRVKEILSKSGISQRAFGEHILKMTSGCVSDLLTKPRAWALLSLKQRQSYQKMLDFLNDTGSIERLRADEQHRCEMNSALNALKAIAGAAAAATDKPPVVKLQPSGLAGLTALVEQQSSTMTTALSPNVSSNSTSTLQIVTSLANELGANTPIGTILKKANSPKPNAVTSSQNIIQPPTTTTLASNSSKRKATPMNSIGITPISQQSITMVGIEGNVRNEIGMPPLKKIPRFQRTLITEKQKEALLFVFAHEQRPNSRCIEQLAAKLGLTPRTVNNWFHNYRTRQKGKETKQEDESTAQTGLINSSLTPTQVLSRALNAADKKTTNWFRELADLLRRHSDANVDLDMIGGFPRGSVGTASAESSPSSPPQMNCGTEDECEEGESQQGGDGDGELCIDEEDEEEEGDQRRDSIYASTRRRGASSNASSSSSQLQQQNSSNGVGGGSQLDKVIARMHSRLSKVQ